MRLYSGSLAVLLLLVALTLTCTHVAAHEDALLDAIELFDTQEYAEVRRVLEELPEEDRKTGTALYYLGRLDLIDGNHKKAAKRFKTAIGVDPDQSDYHYWLAVAVIRNTPYSNFLVRMAGAMKTMKELRKAIELDTANMRARMMIFQMMVRSYDRGGVKKENLVEQARSIARIDSVMGHVAHGTLHQFVDNDMEKARAHFERGYDLSPKNRAAAISYADYLRQVNEQEEAIRVLDSLVQEAPQDKAARFALGTRTILSGSNYVRAEDLFEECLSLKSETGMPSEAMVRWCLGLACHLLGEEDRAQAEWAVVYELDRDFDRILEATPEMSELNSILPK